MLIFLKLCAYFYLLGKQFFLTNFIKQLLTQPTRKTQQFSPVPKVCRKWNIRCQVNVWEDSSKYKHWKARATCSLTVKSSKTVTKQYKYYILAENVRIHTDNCQKNAFIHEFTEFGKSSVSCPRPTWRNFNSWKHYFTRVTQLKSSSKSCINISSIVLHEVRHAYGWNSSFLVFFC